MPLAGSRDADRARAHLRWAERYSRTDEPNKAVAHFGRALEYDRRSRGSAAKSQKFGGPDTELMHHMANAGFAAGATAALAGAAAMPYVTNAVSSAGNRVWEVAKGAAEQASHYMWPRKGESYTREVQAGNNTGQLTTYDPNVEAGNNTGQLARYDPRVKAGNNTGQLATYDPRVKAGGKSDQRAYEPKVEDVGKSDQRAYEPKVGDVGKTDQRAYEPKVGDVGKTDQRAYEPKVEDVGKTDQRAYEPKVEDVEKTDLRAYEPKVEDGGKSDRPAMDEYSGKTDYARKIPDERSSRRPYPLLGPAEARPNKPTIGPGIPSGSWSAGPGTPSGSW
jgi:hypothetical protein